MKEIESLKAFVHHGVEFNARSGDQAIGNCPFCDKERHFYVNVEKKLWDCKVCGVTGNFGQFLEHIAKRNEEGLDEDALVRLAVDRKLPRSAFKGWGIGYDGERYTIPVREITGTVVDLRTYQLKAKTRATTGAKLGLLGAEKLKGNRNFPVYICEGEWDGMALEWLVRKLEQRAVVVAVPGAAVFKQEWVPWFEGMDVIALHDHDGAGDGGRKLIKERLTGIARSVKEIVWPEALPEGFDIRDLVVKEALKYGKPRAAWLLLQSMISGAVVGNTSAEPTSKTSVPAPKPAPGGWRALNPARVFEAYKKWMHIQNDEVLRVMFGAVFANKLQGDPIWLFLVAPPGGSKSELLSSLSRSPMVESTTALTPHSLISGAALYNGHDPSLLPKLDGRILVIKDFTTILSMHYSSRDEIFGVLRDAYDGRTEKTFGTGLKRTYISHFGIIAGVTPKIEEFGVVHQSLGERFLKYRINTGQKTLSEADRIRRAMRNINHEKEMKDDLASIATQILELEPPSKLPIVPPEIFEYIVNLAQTCAMMRGVVERNVYNQQVMYKPVTEVGTRLAKQLNKMALGMAMYEHKKVVDIDIYRVVRRIALDTAPDRVEEIIKRIWKKQTDPEVTLATNEVSFLSHLPVTTCFRVLQDLELLRVVDRVGTGNKYAWKLGNKILKLIEGGRVYERGQ